MRIAIINGKRYVLVIVDDYSRYTWVHFLRSKDEAPKVIVTFLKRITVLLQSPVIIIRTDNGTEFKNQVLKEYFDTVGISHQMSYVRTSQQNEVVERRNRTLVEAARTIFNKTPYEPINGRKPDISFLHVFGALCYPTNDREEQTVIQNKSRLVVRGMIGALMYLTSSRPDIVYAICLCARYQAKSTEKHLKEDYGFELNGFSDADYTGCKDTFKSTSGRAQFLGGKLVSWSSKKQDCTALSTAKAEYVSLSA
nr:hypothetical protein [Tanacetum cinerariifolium]